MVMPTDDKYSTTRNEILDQLSYAMGGRVAEEVVFHDPTTGAANDIEKATGMARKMVTEFGMSERVGAIKLGQSQGEVFLGRDMGHQRDYSEEVASIVDEEVRKLIDSAHDEAWHVINDNRDILDQLVLDLLEHETLNAKELAAIFAPIRKRPVRPTWLSSETRFLSDLPPVLTPQEKAAQNGSVNGYQSAGNDRDTAEAIDRAAEAGAITTDEEHPPTQVVEVPEGEPVDPHDSH
jgi:cell division protease FtsH